MTDFDVALLPAAEAEADDAFFWYLERSPNTAAAFRVELREALLGLCITANDWPEVERGIRRYHLKSFPYTLIYRVSGREVLVAAVAHQRRRPGYWQAR